uniref:Large envelope protein n=1 Tax=Hepatitis B virus TaxID=10407 RepID=A0A8F3HTF8_HBV|nr:MAG: S protein [Hepatitis B virus]
MGSAGSNFGAGDTPASRGPASVAMWALSNPLVAFIWAVMPQEAKWGMKPPPKPGPMKEVPLFSYTDQVTLYGGHPPYQIHEEEVPAGTPPLPTIPAPRIVVLKKPAPRGRLPTPRTFSNRGSFRGAAVWPQYNKSKPQKPSLLSNEVPLPQTLPAETSFNTAPTLAAAAGIIPPSPPPPSAPVQNNNTPSGAMEGYQIGLLGVFFWWTKVLEILARLDLWWTSLSFLGGPTRCNGQASLPQTYGHCLSYCPRECPGYPWMCLRRFIIFLLILLLLLFCWLAYLDCQGMIPICGSCLNQSSETCTCTEGTSCCCCCIKGENNVCHGEPWGFAKFLWVLVLARFSFLSFLQYWFSLLAGNLWIFLLFLTWMTWSWGLELKLILQVVAILYYIFSGRWG